MTTTIITTPAQAIIATSKTQGGGTFTYSGREVTDGVAVGLKSLWSGQEITEPVIDHARSMLTEGFLGTWFDHENGRWEIQETVVLGDRGDALSLARSLGERYIYDMSTSEEVAVA